MVDRLERDPDARKHLRAARQRMAERLDGKDYPLAVLRMRKGLSQKELAEAIGTSQPHIARIESGSTNILLATANELARVLEVSLEKINRALGFPQAPRGT
ncbi:MAG: helix-turn-helix transcriptional regulator [Steroidobacteraceae bacterium]